MNAKTCLIASVLMLSLLMVAVHATSELDNALSLANVSVSPNPVVAGANVTIRFQIYNSYGSWVNNINLQASGSYPIINVSPGSSRTVGQINPGLNPQYYNYTFAIPATTPAGVYKVYFNTSYYALGSEEVISVASMPVSFYVENKPQIKVVTSSPQPASLYSGYNQTLQLQIENTGYGNAKNVTVTVSGEQGVNILSSVTTFFISNLTQGSSVDEPLLVAAKGVGKADILANMTYYSSDLNQRFSTEQTLNLSIAQAARFNVTSGSTDLSPGATDVPVVFQVTNTGSSDANEVQLSLQTSYPATPVASTAYINNLQPGQSTNVTFLVDIDTDGVAGNYPVMLYEQWEQPNGALNQQFSGSNNYFVTVYSSTYGTSVLEAAVAVVVIVALIIFLRRRSSKKTKK